MPEGHPGVIGPYLIQERMAIIEYMKVMSEVGLLTTGRNTAVELLVKDMEGEYIVRRSYVPKKYESYQQHKNRSVCGAWASGRGSWRLLGKVEGAG